MGEKMGRLNLIKDLIDDDLALPDFMRIHELDENPLPALIGNDILGDLQIQEEENDLLANNGLGQACIWSGINDFATEPILPDSDPYAALQPKPDNFEVSVLGSVNLKSILLGQNIPVLPLLNGKPYHGELKIWAKYEGYKNLLSRCPSHRRGGSHNVVEAERKCAANCEVENFTNNEDGHFLKIGFTRENPEVNLRFGCSGDCRKNFGTSHGRKRWLLHFSPTEMDENLIDKVEVQVSK